MIHDPRHCNAFHCACENVRDAEELDAREVSLYELDVIADAYVRENMATCTCGKVKS